MATAFLPFFFFFFSPQHNYVTSHEQIEVAKSKLEHYMPSHLKTFQTKMNFSLSWGWSTQEEQGHSKQYKTGEVTVPINMADVKDFGWKICMLHSMFKLLPCKIGRLTNTGWFDGNTDNFDYTDLYMLLVQIRTSALENSTSQYTKHFWLMNTTFSKKYLCWWHPFI